MKCDKILPDLNKPTSEEMMKSPEFVDQILDLEKLGWGKRRIAKKLGTTKKTVKRYLKQGEWIPYKRKKSNRKLHGLENWLEETFLQHGGNAAVVHQELRRQHNITVDPRTVQRAVKPFRQKLEAKAKATVRFETPPGKQLQIDFGSLTLSIAQEKRKVFFFVATLGYSRRNYVQAFTNERQASWFEGLEGAFRHFGGIPEEVLIDNPKPLVTHHNPLTREVVFNDRLRAFASYWKFKPRACAPYRARTKGKDESGVKYVKRNCIAGRQFDSWEHLEEHILWWMREIADLRIHGTTGEEPLSRFERDEKQSLNDLEGKPPFFQIREFKRVVHNDCCVEVDNNRYSVPWQLVKQQVTVQVVNDEVIITQGATEIARHSLCFGKKQSSVNPEHFNGIINPANFKGSTESKIKSLPEQQPTYELLRPLSEYETIIGGGW